MFRGIGGCKVSILLIEIKKKGIKYEDIVNLIKLRNLLVHRYNGIEEARIFQEIEIIKKYLLVWIDNLEYLINEIRNNQSDSK